MRGTLDRKRRPACEARLQLLEPAATDGQLSFAAFDQRLRLDHEGIIQASNVQN
jgi:hypothetical protein